jgi:tRNA (guanosine-2'-O-)-methyltransferase
MIALEEDERKAMTDRAMDRRELAKTMTDKPSKWPRTERRHQRIRRVLERRQPDLTVVLENVHDPHNVSAVLRSCDAVGILRVHTIYTVEQPPERAYARTISASAAKWIDVERHDSVDACYARLRAEGFRILATALTEESEQFYDLDLTRPVALVFGNEMRGVSEEAVSHADGSVEIPMRGMIESLNISVACAVTLFEAARQRAVSGAYDTPKLSDVELLHLSEDWLRR